MNGPLTWAWVHSDRWIPNTRCDVWIKKEKKYFYVYPGPGGEAPRIGPLPTFEAAVVIAELNK